MSTGHISSRPAYDSIIIFQQLLYCETCLEEQEMNRVLSCS